MTHDGHESEPLGSIVARLAVALVLSSAACGEDGGHEHASDPISGVAGAGSGDLGAGRAAAGMGGVAAGASGVPAAPGTSGVQGGRGTAGASSAAGTSGAAGASGSDGSAAGAGGAEGESGQGGAGGATEREASCLDGITDYAAAGPFEFEATRSGAVNVWVPAVPAGCKVPVLHFANDTGTTCSVYRAILERLASHGFLTSCYESPQSGAGAHCMTALETAFAEHPDLAGSAIGAAGHGLGGGVAFLCVQQAEERWGGAMTIAGHAIAPESGTGDAPDWMARYGEIASPMFVFNGSADMLVPKSWVQQAFDALDDGVEAYWYEAMDAPHVPVPTSWAQESAVVWFRWKLLGDAAACEHFKAMPDGDQWDLQASQNDDGC